MVPPKSPELLAKATQRLILDEGLRRELIAGALEYARSALSTSPSEQLVEVMRAYLPKGTHNRPAGLAVGLTVCQIGSYPPPISGVGLHVDQLSHRLRDVGVNVKIVNTSPPHWRVPQRLLRSLLDLVYFLRITASAVMQRADVYHVHVTTGRSILARLPLLIALRALRRPVVLTMHSGNLRADLAASGAIKRRLTRTALRLPDHGLVTGEETRAAVAAIIGNRRVSDVPLYLGGEAPDENCIPPEAWEFAARHHPLIVVSGGWRPLYDFETIVDTLAMLTRTDEWSGLGAIFLTSFSRNDSPAYQQQILDQVRERGLEEHVIFLPPGTTPHAGVMALLRQAQAIVRSSRSDATGLILHEAMDQGCPAVASDIGSRPEGCLLYPPGDSRALAEALENALRKSRSPVAPKPSAADNLERIIQIYCQLAGCDRPDLKPA